MIESIRATLEAKQAAATLPFSVPISSPSAARTSASEPASPSTKTLVESQTMASMPSSPEPADGVLVGGSARQRIGVDLPVAGVQHRAERRRIARPLGSGIEWVSVIRVSSNGPRVIVPESGPR